MLNLLKLIHVFLALIALASGTAVCIRMVTGRSFEMWTKHFLQFSLVAASFGLILSIGHTNEIQLLTMLTVYASGFAVLSWRKYCTSDSWGPAVVLGTMCVFGLDAVIVVMHILRLFAACNLLDLARSDMLLALSVGAVVLLFASLCTTALKKIHQHASDPLMHKVTR